MKKTYIKPVINVVVLMAEEQIMQASKIYNSGGKENPSDMFEVETGDGYENGEQVEFT